MYEGRLYTDTFSLRVLTLPLSLSHTLLQYWYTANLKWHPNTVVVITHACKNTYIFGEARENIVASTYRIISISSKRERSQDLAHVFYILNLVWADLLGLTTCLFLSDYRKLAFTSTLLCTYRLPTSSTLTYFYKSKYEDSERISRPKPKVHDLLVSEANGDKDNDGERAARLS